MNIYIGNLNYKVREKDLQQLLAEYGEITSVKVIIDRESGRSKGFGFVEMPDYAVAQQVIDKLNGTEYEGRALVVKEARPRA